MDCADRRSRRACALDGFVLCELAAVVVGDGAARPCRKPAQFFGDGIGGKRSVLAEKAPGQGQTRAPLVQRQEDVTLASEVHQIAFPMPELAAQMGFGRPLMDRRAVRDRRLAPAMPPPRFGLRWASSRGRPVRRPPGL